MKLKETARLCSVEDPKGESWEHLLFSGDSSLSNICVSHSSSSINFLQFVTVCFDMVTNPETYTRKHGDKSGNKFNVITLKIGKDERIKSVSGHHWLDASKDRYVLTSLTFRTNKMSYGPFGSPDRDGNEKFDFEVGDFLIGFHGTTLDGILESFGVIIGVEENDDDDIF